MTSVHPVVAALRSRPEGARVALVVEGGGMRGAVSGGMALGLDELGLAAAFDAAYGSSAISWWRSTAAPLSTSVAIGCSSVGAASTASNSPGESCS